MHSALMVMFRIPIIGAQYCCFWERNNAAIAQNMPDFGVPTREVQKVVERGSQASEQCVCTKSSKPFDTHRHT